MSKVTKTVIKAEGLGKKYVIRHQNKEPYETLRDTMANSSKNLVRKLARRQSSTITTEEFWALKNISFGINSGDRVGIIGRNGAGKSTLLKILSRITQPTTGKVTLNGRVASLLEVGTGFHPELTGRENIYLNGSILGMNKAEIERKFNEIVTFAGIEKFLDTPVKRYSSGMYVRLAFAVAAHLDPEILLVDEVLAVGDAQFQKKCLGKMQEAGSNGRTVIFVSHNMAAIQQLCNKCIWLDKGKLIKSGSTNTIIKKYLESNSDSTDGYIDLRPGTRHTQSAEKSHFRYTGLRILNSKNETQNSISLMEPFSLELEGELTKGYDNFVISYSIISSLGYVMVNGRKNSDDIKLPDSGRISIKLDFNENYFAPGGYFISLGANGNGTLDWLQDAGSMHVEQITKKNSAISPDDFAGVIVYPPAWSVSKR